MTLSGVAKVVAILLAIGTAAIVIYGVLQTGQAPTQPTYTPSSTEDPFSEPLRVSTDQADPETEDADTDEPGAIIGDLGETQYTSVDPETGLVRFQIQWTAMDLLGDGRYRITDPVGRFYDTDRTLVVQSDEAEIVWPTRDQLPESGELTGSVAVRLYTGEDRPRAVNPTPSKMPSARALLESESLNFQAALGQIDTTSPVRATFPGVNFEGIGLTVRVSETRGRLQYLRIEEHLSTTLRPDALREGTALLTQPTGFAPAAFNEAEQADIDHEPSDPQIDVYTIELGSSFEIAQGTRRVSAGSATIWARLRDQKLSPDAIAPLDAFLPQSRSSDRESQEDSTDETSEMQDPIVLTGRTSIVIVPKDTQDDAVLASDDLAVMLGSREATRVTIEDSANRFELSASRLNYWAGRRRFEARPTGDGVGIELRLDRPDGQRVELVARNLLADLTEGVVELPGSGTISLVDSTQSAAQEAALSWTSRLTAQVLSYSQAAELGSGTTLTELNVEGAVAAVSPELESESDALRVSFEPYTTAQGTRSSVRAVRLESTRSDRASVIFKDASGVGQDTGAIAARTVEVAFAPADVTDPTSQPVPTQAVATAAVTASTESGSIRAETLTSTFALDDAGQIVVSDLTAQVRVDVRTPDGVYLTGDRVRYRESTSELIVSGESATLAYFTNEDGTAATGPDDESLVLAARAAGPEIRLNQDASTIQVYGPGTAALAERDPYTLGFSTVSASFDRELIFDDASGRFILDGAARVASFATDASRTDLLAATIEVELVRDLLTTEVREELADEPAAAVRRVLLRGNADERAIARLRRYDPNTDRLITAAELVGDSINADARFRRVFVPSDGRLRLLDLSEASNAPVVAESSELAPGEPLSVGFSGKGAATFSWEGSFDLDGRTDIITLTNGVSVRYQAPRATEPTRVDCQSIAIYLDRPDATPASADADELLGPVLIEQINAVGAVLAQHEGRQIIADALIYQRSLNSVTANAARGNRVTVTEEGSAAVLNARSITVDLETNELEGVGIETVTVPR